MKDIRGKPLRNVTEGTPFAVKLVDFNEKNSQMPDIVGQTQEKRESYEMEKYVMTFCDHPNIVSIQMAINMGEPRTLTYRNTSETFVQHDRVYLIMDLADLGSMMDYLNKHCSKMNQQDMINMTRDCFKSIKYLHHNQIVHGDIHMGNVLIFTEELAGGQNVVAKWVDFGLAYVNRKGEYLYRSRGIEAKAKRVYASKIR